MMKAYWFPLAIALSWYALAFDLLAAWNGEGSVSQCSTLWFLAFTSLMLDRIYGEDQ